MPEEHEAAAGSAAISAVELMVGVELTTQGPGEEGGTGCQHRQPERAIPGQRQDPGGAGYHQGEPADRRIRRGARIQWSRQVRAKSHHPHSGRGTGDRRSSIYPDLVTRPLESIRKLPAVGVLAERQMGGFLAMAALIGVGVGLGAAALVTLVDWFEGFFALFAIEEGRVWIFLTVPTGFFAAWLLAKRLAPEISGDGVPQAVAALEVQGGKMRARVIPLKILATALTIGTGGSAGREGPIVHVGGAIGSVISKRFNLGEDQLRSLVAAGAGAGIGAAFNAPIAGMLFALEVILSSFAARHMSAIVIASVTAAVTTQTLVGQELAIQTGAYRLNHPSELVLYAGMAIAVVAVGLLFLRLVGVVDRYARAWERPMGLLRPVITGLLVAGLIFIEPAVFGTGQAVTNELLNGQVSEVWWVLIALALIKAVATALTLSSGGSGGAFMPSLMMGAAVGTGFAFLFAPVLGFLRARSGSVRRGGDGRDVRGRRAGSSDRNPHRLRSHRGP